MLPSCSRIWLQKSTAKFSPLKALIFSLFLQESADATSTQPLDAPCCPLLYTSILWQQGRIFLVPLGSRTRAVGGRHHNHHATYKCCVPNFTVCFILLLQSSTDPGHIPLSRCCTRHFSLPHLPPIYSQIYPLGGHCRHVWQIVMQLPMKAGWRDASLALQDLAMSNLHDVNYGR